MGDVVKLNCETTLPIDPNDILTGAIDKLDHCLLIGIGKDGKMYSASSSSDLAWAVYMATKFVAKVHAGDYDRS
jgi:hypothetical protein